MRSEGYSSRSVCLSVYVCVCVCVYDYSSTTGYEAAYERYQQLQCYKGKKNNVAILLKRCTALERYGVKTSEKANMHIELTSTRFSPFSAPWTNSVPKGICIQVQRCSEPTHDHAATCS